MVSISHWLQCPKSFFLQIINNNFRRKSGHKSGKEWLFGIKKFCFILNNVMKDNICYEQSGPVTDKYSKFTPVNKSLLKH